MDDSPAGLARVSALMRVVDSRVNAHTSASGQASTQHSAKAEQTYTLHQNPFSNITTLLLKVF